MTSWVVGNLFKVSVEDSPHFEPVYRCPSPFDTSMQDSSPLHYNTLYHNKVCMSSYKCSIFIAPMMFWCMWRRCWSGRSGQKKRSVWLARPHLPLCLKI